LDFGLTGHSPCLPYLTHPIQGQNELFAEASVIKSFYWTNKDVFSSENILDVKSSRKF